MLEIKVTVHCPDLVAAAQLLAKCTGMSAATAAAPVISSPAPVVQEPAPVQLQPPVTNPAGTGSRNLTGSPSETPVPLAPAPTFTLAEISKAGADLIGTNPGLLPKVNELLAQYGIQTLDKLRPEQFGAFATALRGLGAKI